MTLHVASPLDDFYLWVSNLLAADLRLFAIFGFEYLVAGARVLECI
jgi:hypothetical protein